MATYRRLVRLGSNCNVGLRIDASSSTSIPLTNAFRHHRKISQPTKPDEKAADTPSMVLALEAQGMPAKQAEAIVSAITEVLNQKLQNVGHSLVTKEEMENFVKLRESNLSKFKSELESSQEHHFSMLKSETEKLQDSIEKMRSDLRFKIDNVTAGQRLDLNLERGRIKDELANQNAETTNLSKKLDQEILALRDQLGAAKYDVMKYYIGALVSISAVGFAVVRIFIQYTSIAVRQAAYHKVPAIAGEKENPEVLEQLDDEQSSPRRRKGATVILIFYLLPNPAKDDVTIKLLHFFRKLFVLHVFVLNSTFCTYVY